MISVISHPLVWITARINDDDDDGEGAGSTVSELSDYNMARQAYFRC